jgi:hypothetical protein
LIRYRLFSYDLLLLGLLSTVSGKLIDEKPSKPRKLHTYKTNAELLGDASCELTGLCVDLDTFLLEMGMM